MTQPLRSNPALKARLERLKAEVRKATDQALPHVTKARLGGDSSSIRGRLFIAFLFVAKIVLVVAFPFVLLVGGSVWLYSRVGMPTWFALILSIGATGGVIAWYVWRVTQKLKAPISLKFVTTRIALPLVLVYCGYSLLYLSRVNAKSDDVRQYYTSVHPLLRVAITTATVFDRKFVVTDMARTPEDYDRMGLPRLENSMHFEQRDGYVHAVDLRTMRRAEWRNGLMRAYFALMGFRTLRHTGTADHLHVSLPVH